MHEPRARRQRDVGRRQEGESRRAAEVLRQRVAVPEAGEGRPRDSTKNPRLRPEYLLKVGAEIKCNLQIGMADRFQREERKATISFKGSVQSSPDKLHIVPDESSNVKKVDFD